MYTSEQKKYGVFFTTQTADNMHLSNSRCFILFIDPITLIINSIYIQSHKLNTFINELDSKL
jgi:hypothetical protein